MLLWLAAAWAFLTAVGIAALVEEMNTSSWQSMYFAPRAAKLTYEMRAGPHSDVALLEGGPYDERLGYRRIPQMLASLTDRDFTVIRQAALSPEAKAFVERHGYVVYREKFTAGLRLNDRNGSAIYEARHPEQTFDSFEAIPPLIVDTLLFIEDRSLLDETPREKNPAVNWKRFAIAGIGQAAGRMHPAFRQGGASTLATQIEKFRHHPGGRTRSVEDKVRQMLAAAHRSYLDGADTTEARRRIVTTYVNATPLSSRPGYGEVIGLGDGLWAWYGTPFDDAVDVLSEARSGDLSRRAQIYKQVLSLILAQRRPSYYLIEGRAALERMTNHHLERLAQAGVISAALRDAALAARLRFRAEPPQPKPVSFVGRKAMEAVRIELLQRLGAPSLYALDRYDLTADTTLDAGTQDAISGVLAHLDSRKEARARGLDGANMLAGRNPARVVYSVVLHERGEDRNFVRVHADNLDRPFDINSGAKLILGSTAKLRTLATYLDIVSRLHARLSGLPDHRVYLLALSGPDPLTQWAASYLTTATDGRLLPMLKAAMQRRYAADPGEQFFTGGGVHSFHNFNPADNDKVPTVEEALADSLNLPFIRLMRDIRDFYIGEAGSADILTAGDGDPRRRTYLRRFADIEGTAYLDRFRREFGGGSPDEVLALMAKKARGAPRRLAILFRSVRPNASRQQFVAFLKAHAPRARIGEKAAATLYEKYAPEALSLNDRAYLARVHPLQLWLAHYLQQHSKGSRSAMLQASADERQDAYEWLTKTSRRAAQNTRIRILIERDAFARIHADWTRQGYPFAFLVPSLASAIGSSGDRPDALAELMGIIVNGGVRQPTVRIERLHFAAGTPYEAELLAAPPEPVRIFAPEVAVTLRDALVKVVEDGTARRIAGVFKTKTGEKLLAGGKTGTGDNRHKTIRGGRLISSRAVDRTATLAFFIGDRFYGTVTAHVAGPEAARYRFTSALASQLLKSLAPQLEGLLWSAGTAAIVQNDRGGTVDGVRDAVLPQQDVALAVAEPQPYRLSAAAIAEGLPPLLPLLQPNSYRAPDSVAEAGTRAYAPRERGEVAARDAGTGRLIAPRTARIGRNGVVIGRATQMRGRPEREVTAALNRMSAAGHLRAAPDARAEVRRAADDRHGWGRSSRDDREAPAGRARWQSMDRWSGQGWWNGRERRAPREWYRPGAPLPRPPGQ